MMEVKNINNVNTMPEKSGLSWHKQIQKADVKVNDCTQKSNSKGVSFKGRGIRRGACKFLMWISDNVSSPQQRALLGITALCTQPFIDLHNSHIKKEDKPITVAKTISKIIVGTTVGILVRHYAIKMVKNFTKTTNCGKYSQCLLPKKIVDQLNQKIPVNKDDIKKYTEWMGTFLGVMCCAITNFVIDAPLSKMLTNIIHEKVFMKEKAHEK